MEEDLPSLWSQARASWKAVDDSEHRGDSDEFKELLNNCQQQWQQLGQRVNELSLFSSNETIRDIQTSSMPYILVPYYLALIEQKRLEDRRVHLNRAKLYFGNFISVCDSFELLSREERDHAEREEVVRDKREQLIARTRKERDINQRLEYLNAKKEQIISTQGIDAYENSEKEEIEREIYLALIKQAVHRTFNEIQMIEQELPILDHMDAMKRGDAPKPTAPAPKKDPMPPMTLYRDHRGELRAEVFRPHWTLPTMSIEEAAELDMQYALRGGGPQSEKKKSDDEDSDPDDDEKYRKQREWDDWCDDNPRGSGNTLGNVS